VTVVLDTNVLISAFVFPGGAPEAVYRLVLEGRVRLVSSYALLAELGRVLQYTFGWEPDLVEEAVAQVVRIGRIVTPAEPVSIVGADPADNRVLEVAAAAEADVIVSDDHHLLDLGSWRGISILAPADFLAGRGGHGDHRSARG
jgi:putative PIN family toxin of toxin-antitoxin system